MRDAAYRLIPLRRKDGSVRAWAKVDAADFDALDARPWHLGTYGYACWQDGRNGRLFFMARVIMAETNPRVLIDHENGDRLDNRRSNLRRATRAQNAQNRIGLDAKNTSGYRGVSWDAKRRRWEASATINGACRYKRYFVDKREAARAVAAFRATHMPFATD